MKIDDLIVGVPRSQWGNVVGSYLSGVWKSHLQDLKTSVKKEHPFHSLIRTELREAVELAREVLANDEIPLRGQRYVVASMLASLDVDQVSILAKLK